MINPTRYRPPTYEQWIETHGLDFSDLETHRLGNEQTRAARLAARRKELAP